MAKPPTPQKQSTPSTPNRFSSSVSVHRATLVFFVTLALFVILAVAWLLGNPNVVSLAGQFHQSQLNPPWFVQVPETIHRPLLNGIFLILTTFVLSIVYFLPPSNRWAKGVIIGILIAFAMRYTLWRVLATLNLSDAPSGLLALAFLALEIPFTLLGLPQLFWAAGVKEFSRAADRHETLVRSGEYLPSVDIFIPTYNESVSILKRTIIGCQAIDYPRTTIYLLDDGHRSPVEGLARELGCEYIIRGDRANYKAGNLNHALPLTQGELIAVFDADFVPTRNFLQRTVGFFQQPHIGLVQSHQNFYNPDAIVRNLGLARYLTNNRESFSRYIQPINSSVGATICDGSAFVVRRRDLESIGGFVTESLSEDYFTGIMLEAGHQRVIYLDENLSAGLAAERLNDYIGQYQRWLMGSLQAFFIPANPLTISGLTLRQRIAHLSNLAFWLTSFPRLLTLFIPIICGLAYVFPVIITPVEWLYFLFLPQFLLLLTLHWLSGRSSSFFLSEVYTVVHAIPFSWAVIQTLIRPFARGFLVTPKSFLSNRFQVNFWLTIPLGLLWLGNGLTLVKFLWERNVPTAMIPPGFADLSEGTVGILIFWWMYNLIILTLAIWACIDPPKTDDCHWFKLAKPVQLTWQDKHIACSSQLIAEQGVRVQIGTSPHPQFMPGDDVEVEIQTDEWPGTIALNAQVSQIVKHSNNPSTQLMDLQFVAVTPPQYRHLVHLLFCRPGQWFRRSHPNELQTFFVLMHCLVRPRFGQKHTDKVIDAIPIR